MKTRVWQRFTAVALLAAAIHFSPAADGDEPKPAAPANDAKPAATPEAPSAPAAPAPEQSPAPATPNAAPAPAFPPKLGLPPLLDQVVRLNKSGADEAVVKAYLEKSAPAYRVTGNDILALQEQGVSKNVILALVENSEAATPPPDPPGPLPAPAPTAPATDTIPEATAPLTPDAAEFYDALAPYGSWMVVPEYGWVWQPTVVVVNPGWQPYSDYGSWLWSDSGWYWDSYYSWGWAPFHYGRWFSHPRWGWCWYPDTVWGPSWVSWRNSPGWCGWAPLPPGAYFTAGIGWTHWGAHVGSDFHFGLSSAHFTFVSHDRFTERHVGRHRLHGHDANNAFAHTKVINNYSHGENNRVFNHGIGREQIAAARGRPIETVAVSDARPQRASLAGARTFNAGARNNLAAGRTSTAQPGRTTIASGAASHARTFSASSAPRASANQGFASRATTTPSFRSGATTLPRVQSTARSSFAPQTQTRFSPQVSRSFQSSPSFSAQRSFASQRPMATARSFSAPSSVQRNFSAQPRMSAPSFRGGSAGGSFGGGFSHGHSGGGGMGVGRSGSAGRH